MCNGIFFFLIYGILLLEKSRKYSDLYLSKITILHCKFTPAFNILHLSKSRHNLINKWKYSITHKSTIMPL